MILSSFTLKTASFRPIVCTDDCRKQVIAAAAKSPTSTIAELSKHKYSFEYILNRALNSHEDLLL